MKPDAEMMAVAEKLARFIESGAARVPSDLFASRDVMIVENFAPFLFTGPNAVTQWARHMRTHLAYLSDLNHTFGDVFDCSRSGNEVYFSVRTMWRGLNRGVPFQEVGGWALVLTKQAGRWRLQGYGWAVIESKRAGLPLQ